jgi:hypothetical protein
MKRREFITLLGGAASDGKSAAADALGRFGGKSRAESMSARKAQGDRPKGRCNPL